MLLPRLELLCGSQVREVVGSLSVTSQIWQLIWNFTLKNWQFFKKEPYLAPVETQDTSTQNKTEQGI